MLPAFVALIHQRAGVLIGAPSCRNLRRAAKIVTADAALQRPTNARARYEAVPEETQLVQSGKVRGAERLRAVGSGSGSHVRQCTRFLISLLAFLSFAACVHAATWFVRPDGGSRYSTSNSTTMLQTCDGLADAADPGTGALPRHCAFNDVRWMWNDQSAGNYGWVMQGGDTLVIRGCSANQYQMNPDNPHCRLGPDRNDNTPYSTGQFWCNYSPQACYMPPPPAGTTQQHTRILGGCAYGTYTCTPIIPQPGQPVYANSNETQLFAGFGLPFAIGLYGTQYVDIEGLEVTSHNNTCNTKGLGAGGYPSCSNQVPIDDYAKSGIITTNTTSNIFMQDVWVHGFSESGISGAIGGPITFNRVASNYNVFAGWNFDDSSGNGAPTANAAGSTITQTYVSLVGNGCAEEYPISHTQFPARGCWDSSSGGFGDSWSGQQSGLDSFSCDHCYVAWNTKDGALGPHTNTGSISLTNSYWYGNMGAAGKWQQHDGSTFLMQNNLVVGNCLRMSQLIPGAKQNFDTSVNLLGSGLSNYCRASAPTVGHFGGANATINFVNNTFLTYTQTIFEPGCLNANACATSPYRFTNNIVLALQNTTPSYTNNAAPGLIYKDDPSVVTFGSHNLYYGIRNDDGQCGTNGTLCNSDPLFANEPTGTVPPETKFDGFVAQLTSASPARAMGTAFSGRTTDMAGSSTNGDVGALNFGNSYGPAIYGGSGTVTPPTNPNPVQQIIGYILGSIHP